nr:C-type lectin domain family 4 member F-like [Procambarus clarkii]
MSVSENQNYETMGNTRRRPTSGVTACSCISRGSGDIPIVDGEFERFLASGSAIVNEKPQLRTSLLQNEHSQPKNSGQLAGDQCTAPFSRVGDTCLLLAVSDKLTWAAARQFCAARGADLVVFRDANAYADALGYINLVNKENAAVGVWVGGTDEAVEGVWTWVTGEPMPRGPPFWGSTDG